MTRMSSLPIARFCAGASKLDTGSGRAAAMSSAFHAHCEGNPKAPEMMARLTEDERAQVLEWQRPEDVTVSGVVLRYDDAEKEVAVGLTEDGRACAPEDPDCLTPGHLDMGWVAEVNGLRVAYVGDIKKTAWTTTDGPDSLQLIAYGLAWAIRNNCDYFACGIWMATEGRWQWGNLVELGSIEAMALWDTVVAAAKNRGDEFSTGTHCRGCCSRLKCPAHLVAPGAIGALEPLTRELTKDDGPKMLELLLQAQAAEDAVGVIKDAAKEYAKRFGLKDPATGKVYRAIVSQGRESLDRKLLEKTIKPEVLASCMKKGNPYETWRWLKN